MTNATSLEFSVPLELSRPTPLVRRLLGCLAVCVVALIAFSEVWSGEFLNIDDNEYVTENEFVRGGLTRRGIEWAFTNAHSGHWHPLTWISHMVDVSIFGGSPTAPHLINLGLHIVAMLGLFLFLDRATGAFGRSLTVTLLIAINPLRLESVAWIAERKDVLSTAFAMWTFVAYLRYVRSPGVSSYLTVVGLLLCGLLAKPMLVSVPLLLLLVDFWPLERFRKRSVSALFTEKVPLLLICLAVSVAAVLAQRAGGALQGLESVPPGERFGSVLTGYLIYFGKFFWPFNRSIYFPLRPLPSGLAAGAAVLLAAATAVSLRVRRERPHLLFGWVWFAVTLLPVIGIVQVGMQHVADRWTYLPHVGLAVALAWELSERARSARSRIGLAVTAAAVLGGLTFVTRRGVADWRTSESIFTLALESAPENFFAHANLGAALEARGKSAEAEHHYAEAIRFNPSYGVALNNLGAIRARAGRYVEAVALFEQALESHPDFQPARYHLGLAHEMLGQRIAAIESWIAVLMASPSFDRARQSLEFVVGSGSGIDCSVLRSTSGTSPADTARLRALVEQWAPESRDLPLRNRILELTRCG